MRVYNKNTMSTTKTDDNAKSKSSSRKFMDAQRDRFESIVDDHVDLARKTFDKMFDFADDAKKEFFSK